MIEIIDYKNKIWNSVRKQGPSLRFSNECGISGLYYAEIQFFFVFLSGNALSDRPLISSNCQLLKNYKSILYAAYKIEILNYKQTYSMTSEKWIYILTPTPSLYQDADIANL